MSHYNFDDNPFADEDQTFAPPATSTSQYYTSPGTSDVDYSSYGQTGGAEVTVGYDYSQYGTHEDSAPEYPQQTQDHVQAHIPHHSNYTYTGDSGEQGKSYSLFLFPSLLLLALCSDFGFLCPFSFFSFFASSSSSSSSSFIFSFFVSASVFFSFLVLFFSIFFLFPVFIFFGNFVRSPSPAKHFLPFSCQLTLLSSCTVTEVSATGVFEQRRDSLVTRLSQGKEAVYEVIPKHKSFTREESPYGEIRVTDPEKVADYTVYKVVVMSKDNKNCYTQQRRFQHFEWLFDQLVNKYPGVIVPPIPQKRIFGRFDAEFVEARRFFLEVFLKKINRHPILMASEDFKSFVHSLNDDLIKKDSKGFMSLVGGVGGMVFSEGGVSFVKRFAVMFPPFLHRLSLSP